MDTKLKPCAATYVVDMLIGSCGTTECIDVVNGKTEEELMSIVSSWRDVESPNPTGEQNVLRRLAVLAVLRLAIIRGMP